MNAPCCFLNNLFFMQLFNEIYTRALWHHCSSSKPIFSGFCRATIDFITWSPKWYFCECTWTSGSLIMKTHVLHYCIDKGNI